MSATSAVAGPSLLEHRIKGGSKQKRQVHVVANSWAQQRKGFHKRPLTSPCIWRTKATGGTPGAGDGQGHPQPGSTAPGEPEPREGTTAVSAAVEEAGKEGGGGAPSSSAALVDAVKEGVAAAIDSEQLVSAVGSLSFVGETQQAVVEGEAGEMVDVQTAFKTVAFWVAAATLFGVGVGVAEGAEKASEFLAGYLLELSLSVDNLFVFVIIFDYFQVPPAYQPKVLAYGIAGAVFFRALLIGLGLTAVQAFEGVNLLFAAVLLFSSFKLLADSDEDEEDLSNNVIVNFCRRLIPVTNFYDGNNFFTLEGTVRKATPLLLTLSVIEFTDIFFAFDSIPAIFGVTQDPFIVFTSNIFAILGLRSLFTVVATSMADLRFLQPAIAAVLGFIGAKLLADFFGYEISTATSLFVVAALLGGGVFLSFRFPKEEKDDSL